MDKIKKEALYLVLIMLVSYFFLAIGYLKSGVVFFVLATIASVIRREYLQHKKRTEEYEKAKKQRIAIENHTKLWHKIIQMSDTKTLPRVDSEEWLKLNEKCVETDCDYEKIGMSPQRVSHLLLALSYDQEKMRQKMEEEYRSLWGELLGMIRNMNFPEKHTPSWGISVLVYQLVDQDYFKYTGEKGELEDTFRRMTSRGFW